MMKKLFLFLVLAFAVLPVRADTLFAPVAFAAGLILGSEYGKPVPYNLSSECKEKIVKSNDGNYSYTSYEHCLEKK